MAGRVLGVAVATVTGIAIGVSTFKPELEAARRKRLEDEYNREVAALNDATRPGTSETLAVNPAEYELPSNTPEEKPSRLSSVLGLWAWQKAAPPNGVSSKNSPSSNDTEGSSR